MSWKIACVLAACAATLVAQTPPVTILEVDLENSVMYWVDVADISKWATLPGPVARATGYNGTFKWSLTIADVVAVNGRPVKGDYALDIRRVMAVTDFTPGRVIADYGMFCPGAAHYVFLHPDRRPIGSIVISGITSADSLPPPGGLSSADGRWDVVVGGTGPFLGARGQAGFISGGSRSASITEDPAYRRINGGNKIKTWIHLIPMTWPEVLTVPTGPAIFHGDDFSPVTAEKPARAGELLVMSVSGLGPVKPNLDPGKPFPPLAEGKVHAVNSPVDVTVNGKAAQVVNALGWPGMNNVYRVDFRVPEGTAAGTATLGLSVAWINGPEVKFPVR